MKHLMKPMWVMIGILGFAVWTLWLNETLAYTETQREQGREVYQVNCLSCHGEAGLGGAGPPLNNILQKLPTEQDVFDYASKFMPVGRAGELSTEEYEAVTAYIMSLNGVEAEQEQSAQEEPKQEEPKKEEPKPDNSKPIDSKETTESNEPENTQKEASSHSSMETETSSNENTLDEDNTSTANDTSQEQLEDHSEIPSEETISDNVTDNNSETTAIEFSEPKKESSEKSKPWLVILLLGVIVGYGVWLIQKKRKLC
jgi:mono/diheme cytochrome c family protein